MHYYFTRNRCVLKLQIRVALSVQEPKINSSVELNETDVIVCKAPLRDCKICPVFASNNLIFLSAPPVANIVPHEEAEIQWISASCTFYIKYISQLKIRQVMYDMLTIFLYAFFGKTIEE